MRRKGRSAWLIVLILVLTMIASACGSDKKSTSPAKGSDQTAGGATGDQGQKGGKIVLAAEQWPDCLNPITSCQNSSWMHWVTDGHVLPRAMENDEKGNFVASPVLAEAPTQDNGGIKTSPDFQITFKIAKAAVWDDGSPITAKDFEFTWKAYLNTTGSLSTTGWDKIASIDTTDPKVAVVKFTEPYADWWDLWGGNQQYILKAAAFPKADPNKPDLKDEMADNIPFSGGPFKLQAWSKQQAVLVRNAKYWDKERLPLLDQVTIVPREDPNTEVNALLTGEADAIYPQPSIGLTQKLKKTGVDYNVGAGTTYEGLWYNQDKPPINDKAVREALSYAVDRAGIISTIVNSIVPGVKVLNCAGWVPNVGDWCDNTQFADFKYNPTKAKSILTGAGWTLGSDGIFAKGGQKLSIEWSTVAGNKRREDTQQLVTEQAKKAGIAFTFRNSDAGELFQSRLPKRDFTIAEYAQVASPDPSVKSLYKSDQIPTDANANSGQNYTSWANPEVDKLVDEADKTVDVSKRADLIHKIGKIVRDDVVWLPLYQLPLITAWRSDKIGGPIGKYTSSSYSGWANMYDWFLKK